jgi:hypothetical protein
MWSLLMTADDDTMGALKALASPLLKRVFSDNSLVFGAFRRLGSAGCNAFGA